MSMLVVEQKKGTCFIKKDDRINELAIVLKGKVLLKGKYEEYCLEQGAVIGLLDVYEGKFISDYYAVEDTILVTYGFENIDDFKKIFEEQPQYVFAFLHAITTQCQSMLKKHKALQDNVRDLYLFIAQQLKDYEILCTEFELEAKGLERAASFQASSVERPIKQWEYEFINGLLSQPEELIKQFYVPRIELTVGEIYRTSELTIVSMKNIDMLSGYKKDTREILVSKDGEDLLELWFDLAKRAACTENNVDKVIAKISDMQKFVISKYIFSVQAVNDRFKEILEFDFENYAKNHEEERRKKAEAKKAATEADYFEYIINYAELEEERMDEIHELLEDYREVLSVGDKDADSEEIRNRMSKLFFEIYDRAFFKSIASGEELSPIMQLFFNFGFFDPQQVSDEHTKKLFEINSLLNEMKDDHVYTFYNWLKLIKTGYKETSKNEFDLDYYASLRELRKANKISEEDEKIYRLDRERMTRFEIENMFKSASKGTYGRGGSYSPILSDANLSGDLDKMFVTAAKLKASIDSVVAVDFGCFYREVMFYDPDHIECRMNIQKEVMPDIILIPNFGTQAMMWQESEGISYESSARFLFPILTVSDIDGMMLETIGRYRWEICRKVQGMRWNDISEHSLTAEYCDYLQYYKRNKNLTPATREKVKLALVHAKGSFREVFVPDYVNWIKYESKGNFRLNKVTREILSRYCPFTSSIRYGLLDNPMFKSVFSRYESLSMQRQTAIKNSLKRYKDEGGEITDELMDTLHFYEK